MPSAIPVTIAPELTDRVRLGLVRAEPVAVGESGEGLEEERDRLCAALRARHAGSEPSAIEGLQPARQLYRSFGIDPTRTRPSSEALLRRILRDKPFPRILNAVDLCNVLAVEFLLPIGLYDADRVRGPVTLRPGQPGESYAGIRKDAVHLEGRPVLADQEGPFGNPTSDSLRTSVTTATRSLWMVLFAPSTFPAERLHGHVERSREGIARHLAPAVGEALTGGEVLGWMARPPRSAR